MELTDLAVRFRRFAINECAGVCHLYACLSNQIADDADLLELASHTPPGQPVPNLLFAAVHDLLLGGADHELRAYYANLVAEPRDAQTAFPLFKDFCMNHATAISERLRTKRVQTNEVRRCAYLYPAFCRIYTRTRSPLALIEIGTSAGLQLLWDQYSYTYETSDIRYGHPDASVHIQTSLQGAHTPELHRLSPPIAARVGIDLHVSNLDDPDDYRWMKALIWPDSTDRLAQFERAAHIVRTQKPPRITGDGVKLLSEVATSMPNDATLCIFHTHVANQFSAESKAALIGQLHLLSASREVFHLYNNMQDTGFLHLDTWHNGQVQTETLAEIDGHGRRVTWLAPSLDQEHP